MAVACINHQEGTRTSSLEDAVLIGCSYPSSSCCSHSQSGQLAGRLPQTKKSFNFFVRNGEHQVGDVYLFSVETGGFLPHLTSTMKECFTRYLNMPSTQVNFLNIKQTLMKENPNIWSDRPMSATLLKVLALEVLHLLNLRQAMLDGMLADFTLLVDSYLNAPCPEKTDDLDRTEGRGLILKPAGCPTLEEIPCSSGGRSPHPGQLLSGGVLVGGEAGSREPDDLLVERVEEMGVTGFLFLLSSRLMGRENGILPRVLCYPVWQLSPTWHRKSLLPFCGKRDLRVSHVRKAKDLTTGEALRGARLFFGQNVLNVEPVEESTNAGQEVEGETLEERSCTQPLKIAQSIHQEEPSNVVRAIKRAVDNEEVVYTVINQFQTMFQSTILHLQSQKVLGLGAAGLNLSQYGKLCWLQVATRKHVLLFDILTMGPGVFKNGLQVVLEDKGILKVIHDCRWLGDILSHQYGVNLNNVFDTQVGDVYLFSVETGGFLPHRTSTMKECLTRYLNMPATQVNFLNIKQTLMKISCSVLPKELQQLCVLQQRRREQALKEYNVNSQGFLTRSENEKPRSHDL
ncbi:piRNA biogenesis protein EXD1-like [Mantella aurantiaca]